MFLSYKLILFSLFCLIATQAVGQGIPVQKSPGNNPPKDGGSTATPFGFNDPRTEEETEEGELLDDSVLVLTAPAGEQFFHFDTTDLNPVTGVQLYRPLGIAARPMARSSNLGQAVHSYSLQSQKWPINFITGGYSPYILTKDSLHYYNVNRPLTILNYTNGAESEQYFTAFHTQNLGEGLNIAFRYDRINSEGFFVRSLTNHTRFHTTYNLHSRNKRFLSRGYYSINTMESQENGGVFIDSANQENSNTALLGINLFEAQQRSRGREIGTDNRYKLLHFGEDSASGFVGIYHKVSWERSWRNFSNTANPDNRFLEGFFIDSTQSADTSKSEALRNTVGIFFDDKYYFEFQQNNFDYFQNYLIDTAFNSNYLKGGFKDSLLKHQLRARFEKGLSGYHAEEYELAADVGGEYQSLDYLFFGHIDQKVPDYFLRRQTTNHRFERNQLSATSSTSLGFKLFEEKSGISLKVQWQTLNNFIYFDDQIKVRQNSGAIQVFSVGLVKRFNFFRNFFLNNRINYQSISESRIAPLPELFSYHSLYYSNLFFKDALNLQLGADIYLIGNYNGYNYDPASAQFFLREEASPDLGNIAQLDLFVNFGITRNGRLFVKFENVLSPSYSEDTERIASYPVPGRALKFGFSWRMAN